MNNIYKIAASWQDLDPTEQYAHGDLTILYNQILNRIPYFLGGLAFLALLYSGFMYVTAFGDTAKMEQAKKNLTWVVIGIIAVAATYIIIDLVLSVIKPGIGGP